MSSKQQKNYFEKLKRFERKFEQKEAEFYKILLQRHKDDEDLDKLSLQKLEKLYKKYYLTREKKNFDTLFKPKND
jgi:hypothetical protein